MVLLLDTFTLRTWRSLFMVYLDNWSMLELIQTNKLLNKHKKYVYMMLFQCVTTLSYNHPKYKLICEPCYTLLYNMSNTYKYNIYKHLYLQQSKIVYSFDNLKILVKNNNILRQMIKKFIENKLHKTNCYIHIQDILSND